MPDHVPRHSDIEDRLLNFSGFLSFLVAMVPTYRNPEGPCVGAVLQPNGTSVFRNVYAIYLLGATGLLIWEVLRRKIARRAVRPGTTATTADAVAAADEHTPPAGGSGVPRSSHRRFWEKFVTIGPFVFALALLAWVVVSDAVGDPPSKPDATGLEKWHFLHQGHNFVAVTMFVGLATVMGLNAAAAEKEGDPRSRFRGRYKFAFRFMTLALLTTVTVLHLVDGFTHLALWLEIAVLVPFGAFWGFQTEALWDEVAPPPV